MNEAKVTRHGMTWHMAGLMLLDAVLAILTLMLALQIYYDMNAPEAHILHVWRSAPMLIIFTVTSCYAVGLYRSLMRYAGVEALVQIGMGTLLGSGLTYLVSLAAYTIQREPNLFLMPRPV